MEVNTLGERPERESKIRDAITIYELNTEFYPESVAIVLALGRLYEADNNAPSAIPMYERALELNPGNNRAQERLEALK
jgi:tetratricopeptide (TPR) repeat protein